MDIELLNIFFFQIYEQMMMVEIGLISLDEVKKGIFLEKRQQPTSWKNNKYILSVEINGEHELDGGFPHFHIKTKNNEINSRFYFDGKRYKRDPKIKDKY